VLLPGTAQAEPPVSGSLRTPGLALQEALSASEVGVSKDSTNMNPTAF